MYRSSCIHLHTCLHDKNIKVTELIFVSRLLLLLVLESRNSLLRNFECRVCMFRQLVAAWVAVVQDYAVLGTHGPLVQAAYTPRLFTAPSLSIISRLLPSLQTCWPAALRALAATLPQAAGNYLACLTLRLDAWNADRLSVAVSKGCSVGCLMHTFSA